jgi:peptidoglycan hydrolase-like protein with peptidoglycan-binding domain
MSLRATALSILLGVMSPAALAQSSDAAKVLAMSIQLELNRLGCDAGAPDGIWGNGSRRALGRYAEKTGAADLDTEPTDALLGQLRAENGRLYTLPPGVVAAEDRSETAHLEAVKFSYTVWTTMPSRTATAKTEYGTLRCTAGQGETRRECSWR